MSRITPFKESVLRGFFAGDVKPADLGHQAIACVERIDEISVNVHMKREKNDDFVLTSQVVLRLCEAAISGDLPLEALPTLAFILEAGSFEWGEEDIQAGETYRRVLQALSCPEINCPLNRETIEMFRRWLLGTEKPPESPSGKGMHKGRLVRGTEAVFH